MLESVVQEQWGGGIFRGRRAPADTVFDAVNALINDEREIIRRGGTDEYGDAAGQTIRGVRAAWTYAGNRVLAAGSTNMYAYVDGVSAPTAVALAGTYNAGTRMVGLGGMVALLVGDVPRLYAGSLEAAYSTGTTTATAGSTTVTGVGTAYLANVDRGSLVVGGAGEIGVVESVDTDTQVTLSAPWGFGTGTVTFGPVAGTGGLPSTAEGVALAAVGLQPRLLFCTADRVFFSGRGPPTVFDADLYHQIPGGGTIVGAEGAGDTALIFTTSGVWAISNMSLDPLDDVGNVQHQVSQVSKDLILWGDSGLSAWSGSVIVPAIDDVYLLSPGGESTSMGEGIRPLYRSYVDAGHHPGIAAVYRGHYVLPILDAGDGVVDALVCRMDLGRPAWTRWDDNARSRIYATFAGRADGPVLLCTDVAELRNLSPVFTPDADHASDIDATEHALTVVTNDLDLGPGMQQHFAVNARVEYDLIDAATDNPTAALSTASGAEGASFTAATATRNGAELDSTDYAVWLVNRSANKLRVKFETAGPAASAVLHRLELQVKQRGW